MTRIERIELVIDKLEAHECRHGETYKRNWLYAQLLGALYDAQMARQAEDELQQDAIEDGLYEAHKERYGR